MIKFYKIIAIVGILFISCAGGDSSDDVEITPPVEIDPIIPSNLTLTITVEGATTDFPNGDGSGIIKCVASATDAVKYGFRLGTGSEVESTTGTIEHTYTDKGTNTYIVYAYAYSSTGDYINVSKSVTVLVSNQFNKLIWSDEFDTDGSPDDTKWGYDIGTGDNGWGNGEKQYYTDRTENVIVEDGYLKITAKREDYEGSEFTSARLKTQGKYDFTYGKLEVKAKLPQGDGVWPAIWTLGSNISTVGWPACGEIDIMEHWGYDPEKVSSATHKPSCYGGCYDVSVGSTTISDLATEFHVYGIEWSEDEIEFYIDGELKYSYKPSVIDDDTWPYYNPQFIILNVAMGGSWFEVESDFTQSTMEIDYVRLYQKE